MEIQRHDDGFANPKEELISRIRKATDPGTLASLSVKDLGAIARFVESKLSALCLDPERLREDFVETYAVKSTYETLVSVTLPAGVSRIEFLEEAQAIGLALYDRLATDRAILERWGRDNAFTEKAQKPVRIAANGNVHNSEIMTRAEQEERGWNKLPLCDLAVLHAAQFVANCGDLFLGEAVRASDGVLRFGEWGLFESTSYSDEGRYPDLAATACPRREKRAAKPAA